jgi:transposase-like protein
MANKKYSDELKKKVVEEYLAGARMSELVRKYDLADKSRIKLWREQYLEHGAFPDGRGKGSKGRPHKIDTSQMTKDEYIKYLEMENDILKHLSSLSSKQQK